jgi:zinc protease
MVTSAVRTDVTGAAISEIFKEIRRMRETSMTEEELAIAKASLVRALPANFQTSADVTGSTINIYVFDLGLDYYSKYTSRLSDVTIDQAKAAAQKYLVPENLIVVVVGDRAKIRADLEKMHLGPSEVRNADGVRVQDSGTR